MSRQLQSCRCSLEVLFLPGALWNFTMDFQPTFPRQISWGGSLLVMSAGSLAMTECFSAVFSWKVHSWGEIMLGIFLFLHRVVQHELPHTVTLSMHSASSVVTSWEETIGTICACQSAISCQLRAHWKYRSFLATQAQSSLTTWPIHQIWLPTTLSTPRKLKWSWRITHHFDTLE